MIAVDSPITIHVHQSEDPKSQTQQSSAVPSKMGVLGKLAVGGALVASGVGASYGMPVLLDALRDGKEIVSPTETPATKYIMDLGSPD